MTDALAEHPGAPRASRIQALSRSFYVAEVALLSVMVLVGFWPFFSRLPAGPRPWPSLVYVHASVFLGWMALLATQVVLIRQRRIRQHRQLGRFGIALGVLVLLLGLAVTLVLPVEHVRAGEWTVDRAAGFLILPLGDLVLFAGLFGAGIAWRAKAAVHKRLMLLAAIALVFPAAARAAGPNLPLILALWLLPLALAIAHDLLTIRRIHPVYWLGTILFLVAFGRVFLMEWEPWLSVGRRIVGAFLQEGSG